MATMDEASSTRRDAKHKAKILMEKNHELVTEMKMLRDRTPLDVDFQRDASLNQVYCTVLPIAFGQKLKCRHETELDYLMHLQGVVEVLRKYDQLQDFVAFVDETNKAPKAGTDSVPFRLNLDEEQTRQIL